MFDVGGGELLLIGLAILLLFGPKKIPEISKMAGKGLRELRKAQMEFQRSIHTISAEVEEATSLENKKQSGTQKNQPSEIKDVHQEGDESAKADVSVKEVEDKDAVEEKVVIQIKPSTGSVAR